jgi:hypothetical protein
MSPPENQKQPRRRSRKHRQRKERNKPGQDSSVAPIRALSRKGPPLESKSADEPLTPSEVAAMKEHFKFLRAHRKLLKLRLNATEDLLLNGVREPTHRGVCQHLLGKVEKDRVLAVSERLPPTEAAKLLAGVLGFAPEVTFVLRYLECIRGSAGEAEAAAALSHALRQIRFDETSNAQMRQVLSLIVGIFPRSELPVLAFNWLFNAAFRKAVDRSTEELPDGIAELVRPLRAIHAELADGTTMGSHRPRAAKGGADVREGARLLLGSARPSLLALPAAIRRRLLEVGLSARDPSAAELAGICALFETETFREPEAQGHMALRVVGRLLAAGDERAARRLLGEDRFSGSAEPEARRWRTALARPRIGPVAIEERAKRRHEKHQPKGADEGDRPPPHRWLPGFLIAEQRRVRLRYGTSADCAEYGRNLELWRSVLLPHVARPIAATAEGDTPYVAVPRFERALGRALQEEADPHRIGVQVCAHLNALALAGVVLPDGSAQRFSLDGGGGVWLVDLWGAARDEPARAAEQHGEYAYELVPMLRELRPRSGDEPALTLLQLAEILER